jgi:hypothetical protein
LFFVPQMPDEKRRPAVDETLRQSPMQRIRQAILDCPRDFLPVPRIARPVRAVRDIGPGSNLRQPAREGVHVTINIVQTSYMSRHPIVR